MELKDQQEDDIDRLTRALLSALELIAVSGPNHERNEGRWQIHERVVAMRAEEALIRCSIAAKLGLSHDDGPLWTIKPNEALEAKWDRVRELIKKEGPPKTFALLEKELEEMREASKLKPSRVKGKKK
jgi:hypothetical protein